LIIRNESNQRKFKIKPGLPGVVAAGVRFMSVEAANRTSCAKMHAWVPRP